MLGGVIDLCMALPMASRPARAAGERCSGKASSDSASVREEGGRVEVAASCMLLGISNKRP